MRILGLIGLLCLVGCSPEPVDFNAEIRPILNEKCVSCHGGVRRRADLSLAFRDDALAGGESKQPALIPGDAAASHLIQLVTSSDPEERMPKEAPPLTPEEVDRLKRWIDQGAPWETHWAYVPPELPAVPEVSDKAWVQSPIDAFILARLEQEGLDHSPEAECRVLARRASLDLTGLPADPDRVDALCGLDSGDGTGGAAAMGARGSAGRESEGRSAPEEAAYATYVDELLASPAFGERWAGLWLDLARYADSKGYEADRHRTIWRWRDWVIDAFNADMPFDRFTIEQLAGDLLPDPTRDQLLATAFHRNAMTNEEGGTDDEEHRVAAVVDRVNTTWEVWQGTTMACTQCHGHPYDPFRQEDYYRSMAVFNNTADWDQPSEEPLLREFKDPEAGARIEDEIQRIEDRIQDILKGPDATTAREQWESSLADPAVAGRLSTTVQNEVLRIAAIPASDRSPHQEAFIRDRFGEVWEGTESLRAERWKLLQARFELEEVTTPVIEELPPERARITRMLLRGSFLTPDKAVAPGTPESLPGSLAGAKQGSLASAASGATPGAKPGVTSGATTAAVPDTPQDAATASPAGAPPPRLAFAEWLVSEDNPLTARVTVNRFWEQLFGTGIVETLEDFGTVGEPPSHPELLDWLAISFRTDMRWSVKTLLRTMVLSSTYRQSSRVATDSDPDNRLLARGPRVRLTGEQLRDQALAVSGLLSRKMHGPSVMPPQPEGIWNNPYNGSKWLESEGDDRHRRALYTYWRRTAPYPSMVTFDAPSREFCVSRRIRTNTPLQALVTLNDPVFWEAAEALAERMAQVPGGDRDRIAAGYRMALARPASPEKLLVLERLYQEASQGSLIQAVSARPAKANQQALTLVANAILNLDEFITRE